MNVVFIVLDSFRQDHVSLYNRGVAPFSGVDACKTPNIDEFARESVVFDNAYPEALPTIPIRCQLMTGQRTLHSRGWQPLTAEDVHVAQILSGEDYVCGLVTDTYHYRAPGMNYHRNFASYDWIRGQEYDPWISAPTRRNIEDYVNGNYPDTWRRRISQFLANTDGFHSAEDEFAWKVVDSAVDWLDANRSHGNGMLWVDSFDPHEPLESRAGIRHLHRSGLSGGPGSLCRWADRPKTGHLPMRSPTSRVSTAGRMRLCGPLPRAALRSPEKPGLLR